MPPQSSSRLPVHLDRTIVDPKCESEGCMMFVMHYRISLGGDAAEAAAAIRKRVAERSHLFDGMPGLARKFFLLDAADPTYATLYLWREPDAALAFLQGPYFAAVIESFGRPEVRLLLSTSIEQPSALPRSVALIDHAKGALSGPASRLSIRSMEAHSRSIRPNRAGSPL
jgi:heme-degrading monooxygenase HmoA